MDFHADWCGPCRALKPILEELARDFEGQVKVCKVDVDKSPRLAQDYGVRSIPTLMLFKAGQAQGKIVGLRSREQLAVLLESAV